MMFNTVKEVLDSLCCSEHIHISIRERGSGYPVYLGGGCPKKVIRRFGQYIVVGSVIIDNILVLFVRCKQ